MEEKTQSIWHRDLNLVFVYVVVFLFGLIVVFIMTSVLNKKVQELNSEFVTEPVYNQNM